jgi:dipeptidyl aminopeptidase/acylaminoacyl peptidase
VGGDVFVISRDGGTPRNLTPERKASAVVVAWTSEGKIIDMENVDGESSISRIDPVSGQIEPLYREPVLLTSGFWSTSLSLTPDGMTAASVRSSFADPPEVWAGPIGKWKQVTHRNTEIKPAWGEAKSLHWKSDGLGVQGWLIYPKNFDPSKKYPMVVGVHGGPGAGVQPNWPGALSYEMALPARGYFLFLPNPRGSFGQGETFTRANVKDFGYGDWRDILAGVDEVLRTAPVDPNRLGLTGWSYGGYMTMWGVTQTDRFRAAVAGAGLANWSSYYGENKIDQWMIPFFGKSVYDDPEIYARSAPLTFIKNVKTPTLMVVGDSDGECPTPQSYEFWHALKTLGVETELVVYEHEGHMFVKPEHMRDVIQRASAWFDDHLK